MTISSETRKAGPYSANGATVTFPFTFKCFSTADVQVVLTDESDVETVLTLTSQYTVALNADQNTSPGGSITTVATYASGNKITIVGDVDYQQDTDITNGGGFYPEVIENALDKATMQIQQLKEQVDRSAKLPVSSTTDADALVVDLIRLADSADNIDTVAGSIANVNAVAGNAANINTVAGINDDVTAVAGISANVTAVDANSANINAVAANETNINTVAENLVDVTNFADVYQGAKTSDPTARNDSSALQDGDLYFNTSSDQMRVYGSGIWSPVTNQAITITQNTFTGDGVTKAFTLSDSPVSKNNVIVEVGGVVQSTSEYSVSATTLTFTSAPTNGVDIETRIIATVNNLNSAASSAVSFNHAQAGALTRSVESKLREIVTEGDFASVAQAKAAAGSNYLKIYNPITVDRNSIKEGVTVTGAMSGNNVFMRAFTDTTTFESTTDGAYTSYDTTALVGNGSTDPGYNHSYGYEARHTFRGSAGIDNMYGFYSGMTVNGAAGAKLAAAVNCFGFMHDDPLGSGTIYNNSGFYCNDLTRGTFNYALNLGVTSGTNKYNIYAGGNAQNYIKGALTLDGAFTFNGGGTWGANTKIAMSGNSGFRFATNTNLVFGGAGTLTSISSLNDANNAYNPLNINATITVMGQGPIRLKSYTVATLPSASASGAGAKAFVTDANATTFASVVAAGGANGVPVYSDGTNWRIG